LLLGHLDLHVALEPGRLLTDGLFLFQRGDPVRVVLAVAVIQAAQAIVFRQRLQRVVFPR